MLKIGKLYVTHENVAIYERSNEGLLKPFILCAGDVFMYLGQEKIRYQNFANSHEPVSLLDYVEIKPCLLVFGDPKVYWMHMQPIESFEEIQETINEWRNA